MRVDIKTVFRRLRDVLACLGVISVLTLSAAYFKGRDALGEFDPGAAQVIAEFARTTISRDFLTATQTRVPLPQDASTEEVVDAMQRRAEQKGMSLASRRTLHADFEDATEARNAYVEQLEFCDAETEASLLRFNTGFSVHAPCRISVYQDNEGNAWLAILNLDVLVHVVRTPEPALRARVVALKDNLLDIATAGATAAASGDP